MNKTTAALKLAEEALEKVKKLFRSMTADECPDDPYISVGEALAAIREALAEQSLGEYHGKLMREVCNKVITETLAEPVKQEPVAWVTAEETFCGYPKLMFGETPKPDWIPLYAAPVSAKMQGDCTLAAVLAEREACAKVCMKQQYDLKTRQTFAAAIRARGEK